MPDNTTAKLPLLGGHTPAAFLRRFWQKEALLVRGAIPDFAGLHTRATLFALAGRDDVEARLLVRSGRAWTLEHGPFPARLLRTLPAVDWTLLVQGVNLESDAADTLLRRFAFLPFARLDDLMVSYAAPGGGVGPHFDSYDVFLLQGFGRRRWRYGRQQDLALRPGLPVKILRRFVPQHDTVLAPGDMLYLPPAYAHDGIAVDACTT
ncbi:MAG: cupin domain-containing protein, partial [Betaproteobacteria bacterium]